jgi:hypothetical protein
MFICLETCRISGAGNRMSSALPSIRYCYVVTLAMDHPHKICNHYRAKQATGRQQSRVHRYEAFV